MSQYLQFFYLFGGATALLYQSFIESFRRPVYFGLMVEQVYQVGVRSLPLVLVTALSTGMVMALQFGLGRSANRSHSYGQREELQSVV